jgi:hypothetical protein
VTARSQARCAALRAGREADGEGDVAGFMARSFRGGWSLTKGESRSAAEKGMAALWPPKVHSRVR